MHQRRQVVGPRVDEDVKPRSTAVRSEEVPPQRVRNNGNVYGSPFIKICRAGAVRIPSQLRHAAPERQGVARRRRTIRLATRDLRGGHRTVGSSAEAEGCPPPHCYHGSITRDESFCMYVAARLLHTGLRGAKIFA